MWGLQHFIRPAVSAVLVAALQLATSGANSPALAEAAVKIPPVELIRGDDVYVTDGPPAGTPIVVVGAAELYGTEKGVGH